MLLAKVITEIYFIVSIVGNTLGRLVFQSADSKIYSRSRTAYDEK